MLACSTLMGITGIFDGEPAPGFLYIDGCSQMCALLMEVIPLHTGCHYEGDTVLIELFGWVATYWMNGWPNGCSARRLLCWTADRLNDCPVGWLDGWMTAQQIDLCAR